ncbi:DUF7220 family protein [Paracoccus sediminicola]|uniref:DUF7220 family protein n=1 Tax=Paracoccus sediminicola TaxID=3017783 RepID=UPI003EB99629
MKQSRTMSMVEAAANVVVGYGLAIATQIVVFPWFGIETGLAEHLTIGLAFVGVSLARGYLLRRLFETVRMRKLSTERMQVGQYLQRKPKSKTNDVATDVDGPSELAVGSKPW